MSTGAVIVAAGLSSRMGDFKPMLKLGSMTIASRVIATFSQAGAFPIVLVTGFRADELEKHVAGSGAICIRNESYASTEMIDSALIGLQYIKDKCERTFFTPVDVPLFTMNTLVSLEESRFEIAKPSFCSKAGHPMLMDSDVIDRLGIGASDGLRGAVAESGAKVGFVEVADEGILADVDTPEDYTELLALHNRQLLRPKLTVSLEREDTLFDAETALMLRLIEYTGSVRSASEQMHISYSKAWNKLKLVESGLGYPLIARRPGGATGGGSSLTREGKTLLERFDRFKSLSEKAVKEAFEECFGDE